MSQGDYLKRKQIAHRLRIDGGNTDNKQPAVFSSNDLIKFKQYQIVNEDSSTNINYNLIKPTGTTVVFDMERKIANCPTFIACSNTNTRPNRVLNIAKDCNITIHPLTWQQRKNVIDAKSLCLCQLKSIYKNRCNCDNPQ